MAAVVGIRAKVDASLIKWAENAPAHFRRTVVAGLQAIGFEAGVRAQANAPILSGDLRRSIRATKVVEVAGPGGSLTAEVQVEASEPYALRMHEQLTPVGPLGLGPLSRIQPPTREGGVGGKYLSRAIERNIKAWERSLGDTVERNIGRAAKSTKVELTRIFASGDQASF